MPPARWQRGAACSRGLLTPGPLPAPILAASAGAARRGRFPAPPAAVVLTAGRSRPSARDLAPCRGGYCARPRWQTPGRAPPERADRSALRTERGAPRAHRGHRGCRAGPWSRLKRAPPPARGLPSRGLPTRPALERRSSWASPEGAAGARWSCASVVDVALHGRHRRWSRQRVTPLTLLTLWKGPLLGLAVCGED